MELVQVLNDNVVVSSRMVAKNFGKAHKELLKSIEGETRKGEHINGLIDGLVNSGVKTPQYFIPTDYKDLSGKMNKEYLLTRDGFSLLVMGFTGQKALGWKLKYIDAFNKMEEEIKRQNSRLLPKTYKESLLQLIEQIEINEQLLIENEIMKPKSEYHDVVLNKEGLITTTIIAKDLGMTAAKLNTILHMNKIIFRNQSGIWIPYKDYEWLVTDGYADYQSHKEEKASPTLKWTELGRQWIINNIEDWKAKI